jgi:hypothetical protein
MGRHVRLPTDPPPVPRPVSGLDYGVDGPVAPTARPVTGWEKAVGLAVWALLAGVFALGTHVVHAPGWLFWSLLLPGLKVAFTVGAHFYTDERPAWPGPKWLRDSRIAKAAGNVSRFLGWADRAFVSWCRMPGRVGFALVAVGVILGYAGWQNASSDRDLLSLLRSNGVDSTAIVRAVRHDLPHRREVDVQIDVGGGGTVTEPLRIVNTAPTVELGDRVHVVYWPYDPTLVLLATQMHDRPSIADYMVADAGGLLVVSGLSWWAARRPARRRLRPTGRAD